MLISILTAFTNKMVLRPEVLHSDGLSAVEAVYSVSSYKQETDREPQLILP